MRQTGYPQKPFLACFVNMTKTVKRYPPGKPLGLSAHHFPLSSPSTLLFSVLERVSCLPGAGGISSLSESSLPLILRPLYFFLVSQEKTWELTNPFFSHQNQAFKTTVLVRISRSYFGSHRLNFFNLYFLFWKFQTFTNVRE